MVSAIRCFLSRGVQARLLSSCNTCQQILAILQENDSKCDLQLAPNAFLTYALILWKQIKPRDKCTYSKYPMAPSTVLKSFRMLLGCQMESLASCLSTNTPESTCFFKNQVTLSIVGQLLHTGCLNPITHPLSFLHLQPIMYMYTYM